MDRVIHEIIICCVTWSADKHGWSVVTRAAGIMKFLMRSPPYLRELNSPEAARYSARLQACVSKNQQP